MVAMFKISSKASELALDLHGYDQAIDELSKPNAKETFEAMAISATGETSTHDLKDLESVNTFFSSFGGAEGANAKGKKGGGKGGILGKIFGGKQKEPSNSAKDEDGDEKMKEKERNAGNEYSNYEALVFRSLYEGNSEESTPSKLGKCDEYSHAMFEDSPSLSSPLLYYHKSEYFASYFGDKESRKRAIAHMIRVYENHGYLEVSKKWERILLNELCENDENSMGKVLEREKEMVAWDDGVKWMEGVENESDGSSIPSRDLFEMPEDSDVNYSRERDVKETEKERRERRRKEKMEVDSSDGEGEGFEPDDNRKSFCYSGSFAARNDRDRTATGCALSSG